MNIIIFSCIRIMVRFFMVVCIIDINMILGGCIFFMLNRNFVLVVSSCMGDLFKLRSFMFYYLLVLVENTYILGNIFWLVRIVRSKNYRIKK